MCDCLLEILDGHWAACHQCQFALASVSAASQPDSLTFPCAVGLSLYTDHLEACESCDAWAGDGLCRLIPRSTPGPGTSWRRVPQEA
jgi:hypothetical protein